MNYTFNHRNLRLLARDEGKIKSYESCSDVRAWSHDVRVRDRYLREWIKCDMPISVIPIRTLASFLRTMTCRSRGRATPRCHPDCKSKVLLESICGSCHVMKQCLVHDQKFEKYFEEEEMETSHWPCERCLDALKSIKMFWKIIVEKIFNIDIPKSEEFDAQEFACNRTNSVKSVAKVWQSDMVHQALFIKNITPRLKREHSSSLLKGAKSLSNDPAACNKNIRKIENYGDSHSATNAKTASYTIKSQKARTLDSDCTKSVVNSSRTHSKRSCRKVSRCTSVRVKLLDIGCETCNIEKENEDLKIYKTNLEYLQEKFNVQTVEIERLKNENTSLRIELQNVYKSCPWRPYYYSPTSLENNKNVTALVPKPFDSTMEENIDTNQIKDTDSEMIITMKNCTNETFKHVSLLQVLHKTNAPILTEVNVGETCCSKEDPINLLAKVHTTFGAIVRREMSIASDRGHRAKSNIEATFHRVNASRSAPSCSTISAYSTSSDTNFVSTKNMCDLTAKNQ